MTIAFDLPTYAPTYNTATQRRSARVNPAAESARQAAREAALARLRDMRAATPARPAAAERRGMHVVPPTVDSPPLVKPKLSAREAEVLKTWLLVDSKNEVGEKLYISLGTVNTHLARIRVKYEQVGRPASTKAALVARAVQDGLVSLDEL